MNTKNNMYNFHTDYRSRGHVKLITVGLWLFFIGLIIWILYDIACLLLLIGGIKHFFDSRKRIKKLKEKLTKIHNK